RTRAEGLRRGRHRRRRQPDRGGSRRLSPRPGRGDAGRLPAERLWRLSRRLRLRPPDPRPAGPAERAAGPELGGPGMRALLRSPAIFGLVALGCGVAFVAFAEFRLSPFERTI